MLIVRSQPKFKKPIDVLQFRGLLRIWCNTFCTYFKIFGAAFRINLIIYWKAWVFTRLLGLNKDFSFYLSSYLGLAWTSHSTYSSSLVVWGPKNKEKAGSRKLTTGNCCCHRCCCCCLDVVVNLCQLKIICHGYQQQLRKQRMAKVEWGIGLSVRGVGGRQVTAASGNS